MFFHVFLKYNETVKLQGKKCWKMYLVMGCQKFDNYRKTSKKHVILQGIKKNAKHFQQCKTSAHMFYFLLINLNYCIVDSSIMFY